MKATLSNLLSDTLATYIVYLSYTTVAGRRVVTLIAESIAERWYSHSSTIPRFYIYIFLYLYPPVYSELPVYRASLMKT